MADSVRYLESRVATLEELLEAMERTVLEQAERLERARQDALAAARAQAAFLANMSHEIRAPLNGMIGMTGLLAETDLTPVQLEYLESSRTCAEHLLDIVNDVLDLSTIEADKLTIHPVPFDPRVLVEEAVELLAPRADEKGVELLVRLARDVPKTLLGDPGRIRQVLVNLAANAIKFTTVGEVVIQVAVETKRGSQAILRFSVKDTGIGISDGALAHLFERFTQADAVARRDYGGTGLGLAISKQIIELMDGTITVKSELGRGSEFFVDLPLTVVDAAPQDVMGGSNDLRAVRVLIVDDNATSRRFLQELMTDWGMRASAVASGPQALETLARASGEGDPYRIAVIDQHMPEMDGIGLARLLKRDTDSSPIGLLLLSSPQRRAGIASIAEAGFAAYLTKPVFPAALKEALSIVSAPREGADVPVLISRRGRTARYGPRSSKSVVAATFVGTRVLVVDDEPVGRKVAERLLKKLGCRVDVATNGGEAVEMFSSRAYEIVFMDCEMRDLNGYEATRMIRRQELSERRCPIIALTAHSSAGALEKCREAGMNDCLVKPVRAEHLSEVLRAWIPKPSAKADPAVAGLPTIGLGRLEDAAEGDPIALQDLVDTLLRGMTTALQEARSAASVSRFDEVARLAHGAIGPSATIEATSLVSTLRELEQAAQDGNLAEVHRLIDDWDRHFRGLREKLCSPTHR